MDPKLPITHHFKPDAILDACDTFARTAATGALKVIIEIPTGTAAPDSRIAASAAGKHQRQDMNPLHWKREHQIAWIITMMAGAAAGMILGWFASPFSHLWNVDTGTMFLAWLHYPMTYWAWVLGGAVAGGLTYYAGDLLTGAR